MVVRFDRLHLSWPESRCLGRHLAEARRAAGASGGELAHRLGITEVTLRAYEEGRARFPVRLVFAAARMLGVSPYHLLAGRADQVLNPWEPEVAEWRRVRRLEGPPPKSTQAEEELSLEPVAWDSEGPEAEVSEDGDQEPFEALTGDEARRAIEFLDEAGPSGRISEEEEDW